MENIMKDFVDFINEKEKKSFKEGKEKAIKNAMEVVNGAEQVLICTNESQTSICGDGPSLIAAIMSLINGLVARGSIPADIMENALLEVIKDFKGEQEGSNEELDVERELKNKLKELMDKIEKM